MLRLNSISFIDTGVPSKAEEITIDKIESLESPEYEYIVSQYDAGIRRADHELGQLVQAAR